jgi:hypothetical protein
MNGIKYSFTFGKNHIFGCGLADMLGNSYIPDSIQDVKTNTMQEESYYDPISEIKVDPDLPLPVDDIKKAIKLANKYKKMVSKSLIYKKPSKIYKKTSHLLNKELISERERKEDIKEFNRDMNTSIFDYLKEHPLVYYHYHMGDNWNLIFKKVTINWTETNTNNIMMPVEKARSENFLIAFIIYWGDEKVDYKDVTKEIIDSCPKFKVRSENHAIEIIRGMGR